MTREQARKEAQQIATTQGVRMALLFERYADVENPESERFNYCPLQAAHILSLSEVVETLEP